MSPRRTLWPGGGRPRCRAWRTSPERLTPRTSSTRSRSFSWNSGRPSMGGRVLRAAHAAENALSALALTLLVLIPAVEVAARMVFHSGVSGSVDYTQHLVLVATFLAGAVTSRERRHLSMALDMKIREPLKSHVGTAVAVLGGGFCLAFAWSSLGFSLTGFEASQRVGAVSLRLVSLIMAAGY